MKPLAGQPFLAGQQFMLGDLAGAIATEYLERLGVQPSEPIRAWKRRCFETPGLARTFAQTEPMLVAALGARAEAAMA